MATNSINTTTSDTPISEYEARALLYRIRTIMAETELPFAPAVDIYIKETYGEKSPEDSA